MDSLWTQHRGERYHVLGIELTDPDLIFRTRRVVHCCIGMFSVLVLRTLLLLMIGDSVSATLLSLLFNLSIPAFGYLGARDGSASLMCIFVALMLLNAGNAFAVLFLVSFAVGDGRIHLTWPLFLEVFLLSVWGLTALVAAHHASKLFNKLAESSDELQKQHGDPEAGLPEIDTQLEEIDRESFGLPTNHLHERDIDDELSSPIRRKKGSASPRDSQNLKE